MNPSRDPYARFMFSYWRLPAYMMMDFAPFMKERYLFCTYQSNRYRVTGASRFGDVWLTRNFRQESGYEQRVNIDDCSDWSAKP